MVIKFATFDPAQNPDDFNPAFPPTPSSSPSATLCQPCEYTCTFTRAIVGRLVAASASLVLTPQAFEIDGHEIQDQSAETPLHSISSVVHPEFHQRQLKEFNLKELEVATQNFSNLNILGRGGFGNVYKGRLADGSTVAIKRCKAEKTQVCIAQFETEVMVGSIIPPHCNLLTMLGFCRTSKCRELLLVSPFRSNGSVSFRLRHRPKNQSPLDWPSRMKIATGAARGLSHLHDLNILHRDIKAANILLDEEFEPHIGDFGLAKFIDRSHGGYSVDCIEGAPVLLRKESKAGSDSGILHVTTAVRGTIGHIAPEYLSTGKCSVKTDVFAFGTMLLELVTGERALDLARRADDNHLTLLDWVEGLLIERRWGILVDPDLQGACNEEEIEKVIQLALLCTQSDPRGRPSAAQVVRILEGQSIEKRWREYRRWQEYLNDLRPLRSNDWIVELQLFNSFFWKKSSGPDDQDYLKKHSTDFSQPCWDCRHLN